MMPPHRPHAASRSTIPSVLPLLVAVTVLAILGGCVVNRQPEIRIADLRWSEVSSDAALLDIELELRNPSSERLDLLEFQYHLEIDGRREYTGRHAARTSLGPGDVRQMTIPAVVSFESVGWSVDRMPTVVNYALSGHLRYTLPGYLERILHDLGVLRPKQGFSERGRLQSGVEAASPDVVETEADHAPAGADRTPPA